MDMTPVEELSTSLMTPLGVVEGDILAYLEAHGATPLRRLVRELEWPSPMVMMGVGALVRERLIQARQHELEVIVEARISTVAGQPLREPPPWRE
jgi:hypothetical protein